MDRKYRTAILQYSRQEISKKELLLRIPQDIFRNSSLPVKIITEGLESQNEEEIDIGYTFMLVQSSMVEDIPINTDILCKLLLATGHTLHESIAMILKSLKDPSTVDCLYNAAELEFAYLEYDETFQLARKCIKALAQIDNNSAVDKLRLLSESRNPVIAEYAKKELNFPGESPV